MSKNFGFIQNSCFVLGKDDKSIPEYGAWVNPCDLFRYRKSEAEVLKKKLYHILLEQNSFWSYDMSDISMIPDEKIILNTLVHLDLPEIDILFRIWDKRYIKKIWREQMAIQGDYYRTLNLFLAWRYFGVKEPRKYLKMIETKHINSLCL